MCSHSCCLTQDRIGYAAVTNKPWNLSDFMPKGLFLNHIQFILCFVALPAGTCGFLGQSSIEQRDGYGTQTLIALARMAHVSFAIRVYWPELITYSNLASGEYGKCRVDMVI